jgi:hypothetical protein
MSEVFFQSFSNKSLIEHWNLLVLPLDTRWFFSVFALSCRRFSLGFALLSPLIIKELGGSQVVAI